MKIKVRNSITDKIAERVLRKRPTLEDLFKLVRTNRRSSLATAMIEVEMLKRIRR